jgi:hypothetical protein
MNEDARADYVVAAAEVLAAARAASAGRRRRAALRLTAWQACSRPPSCARTTILINGVVAASGFAVQWQGSRAHVMHRLGTQHRRGRAAGATRSSTTPTW